VVPQVLEDETLGRLEAEARAAKRGLWADANPTPPWEWRAARQRPEVQASPARVVPNGIEIAALLPNPAGKDEGHEQVVYSQHDRRTRGPRRLEAADRAGNVFALSETVPASGKLALTMTEPTMSLDDHGDEVLLIDAGGVVRSWVAYTGQEARSGAVLGFGR